MNRRQLLRGALAASLGCGALPATTGALAAAARLARLKGVNDYRALVCVYLYGGNDSFNMLVPGDVDRHAVYAGARGPSLTLARDSLLPISDAMQGDFGLHPTCTALQTLYQQNRLAFVTNTGTLVRPTTRSEFDNDIDLPRHLFSHNSQQDQTMTALPQQPSRTGWAGRLAEIMHDDINGGAAVPLNLSISGQNLLQVGVRSNPAIVSSAGMPTFNICGLEEAGSACGETLASVFSAGTTDNNALIRGHSRVYQRTHELSTLIGGALQNAVAVDPMLYPTVPADFPGNPDLGLQLQTVTRLISVAQQLGHQRSLFFVSLGGWDTHDNQLTNHALLLANLSANLAAFQTQLNDLGVADQVLTFTGSDFGRTLTSNGDGSDHGWGGNQLVMGSENILNGGALYGQFPDLTLGSANDADLGRIIPTTPLDAMHATLARWLGVADGDLLDVFPNLVNFDGSGTDLGFLAGV